MLLILLKHQTILIRYYSNMVGILEYFSDTDVQKAG